MALAAFLSQADLLAQMPTGEFVIGKIVDEGGSPLRDASVSFVSQSDKKSKFTAQPNLQGFFVAELAAGEYTLEVWPVGARKPLTTTDPFEVKAGVNAFSFSTARRSPEPLQPRKGYGLVWGILLSAERTRLDDALVSFGKFEKAVKTHKGFYVFESKKGRAMISVFLKTDLAPLFKHATQLLPSMEVKNFVIAEDITRYDLIFPRGKNITVKALDVSDGRLIEGMRFVLEPMRAITADEDSKSQVILRFQSFQQRRASYSFKNVPPGNYVLRALDSQRYYLADDSSSYFLDVQGDATFKVWFAKPMSMIQGTFAKVPKEFLRRTALLCARSLDSISPSFLTPTRSSMYARPNPSGVFKLAPLPLGRYSVAVYLPQSEELVGGVDIETLAGAPFYLYVYGGIEILETKGTDITPLLKHVPVSGLGALGSISGWVVTQNGEKVGRARIFVVHGPYPGFVLGRTEYRVTATMTGNFLTKSGPHPVDTTADENGRFMINCLPPGSYDLLVLKANGGLTWQGQIVTVKLGPGKKETVNVMLPEVEGGKLAVTISVKDPYANPVRCLTPRFYAFIKSDKHNVVWLAAVNKEGTIKLENIPEGMLYVTMWDFRPTSFVGFNRKNNCSFVVDVKKDKTNFTYTLPKAR